MSLLLKATEAEFQNLVVDLARHHRWRIVHFRPARTEKGWRTPIQGDAGFVDLVMARDGHVIFAELKAQTGRLTGDQKEWGFALTSYGEPGCDPSHHYFVWRPSDLDEIKEVLR